MDLLSYNKSKAGAAIDLTKIGPEQYLMVKKGFDPDTGVQGNSEVLQFTRKDLAANKEQYVKALADAQSRVDGLAALIVDLDELDKSAG